MRETLDGFQGGLQIGGRMVTNLRYTDDIILLATWEAKLQELVDCLDQISHKWVGTRCSIYNKTRRMHVFLTAVLFIMSLF